MKFYRVERGDRELPWGTPELVQLSPPVYGYPGQPANLGQQIALTRIVAPADWEIHLGQLQPGGGYAHAPLPGINSLHMDKDPWISDDLRVVFFAVQEGEASNLRWSTRPQPQASFAAPAPVPGLDDIGFAEDPWLTPDLRVIYFTRRLSGTSDLYRAER